MSYHHLTFTNRLQIEAWDRVNTPAEVMAENLGVHVSTVYRELKRGRYTHLNTDLTTEERYTALILPNGGTEKTSKQRAHRLKSATTTSTRNILNTKCPLKNTLPGLSSEKSSAREFSLIQPYPKQPFTAILRTAFFSPLQIRIYPLKRTKTKRSTRELRRASLRAVKA